MGLPLLITLSFLLPPLPQAVAVLQFGLFSFSLWQLVLLLYSFPLQVSNQAGIWKSCSPPQEDLCEQCHQISRLFAPVAHSDLQISLCEVCWRQAAAGLVGVFLRERVLNLF